MLSSTIIKTPNEKNYIITKTHSVSFSFNLAPICIQRAVCFFFCNWQEMTREHSPPFTNTSTESIPCPLSSICPSVVWLIYINRPLMAVCEGQVDVLPLQAHIFLCYEVICAETVYRDLVQKPSLSHTHRHTQPSIK